MPPARRGQFDDPSRVGTKAITVMLACCPSLEKSSYRLTICSYYACHVEPVLSRERLDRQGHVHRSAAAEDARGDPGPCSHRRDLHQQQWHHHQARRGQAVTKHIAGLGGVGPVAANAHLPLPRRLSAPMPNAS